MSNKKLADLCSGNKNNHNIRGVQSFCSRTCEAPFVIKGAGGEGGGTEIYAYKIKFVKHIPKGQHWCFQIPNHIKVYMGSKENEKNKELKRQLIPVHKIKSRTEQNKNEALSVSIAVKFYNHFYSS